MDEKLPTSAHALNKLLSLISTSKDVKEPFVKVAAKTLNLHGDEAEIKAIATIQKLIRQVQKDLESLDLEPEKKTLVNQYISPFVSILSFHNLQLTVEQAKSQFLHGDRIMNLMNLDMTLEGRVEFNDIDQDTKNLSKTFRDVAEDLEASSIPDVIKKPILKRCMQIIAALENYKIFGSQYLTENIQALVGVLVTNNLSIRGESWFKKVLTGIAKVGDGINKANRTYDEIGDAKDNLAPIIQLIGENIDKA